MEISEKINEFLESKSKPKTSMKTIEGKLESVRKIFGWSGDFEVVVDGESYYEACGDPNNKKKLFETLTKNIGKKVCLQYSDNRDIQMYIIDRVLLGSWGVPCRYREVDEIRLDNLC